MAKKPLEPLIPLDDLKKVLAEIVHATPEEVQRVKVKTKKKGIVVKAKTTEREGRKKRSRSSKGKQD